MNAEWESFWVNEIAIGLCQRHCRDPDGQRYWRNHVRHAIGQVRLARRNSVQHVWMLDLYYALQQRDFEAAEYAARRLLDWLAMGGDPPDNMTVQGTRQVCEQTMTIVRLA
jgi:hypothetical protein